MRVGEYVSGDVTHTGACVAHLCDALVVGGVLELLLDAQVFLQHLLYHRLDVAANTTPVAVRIAIGMNDKTPKQFNTGSTCTRIQAVKLYFLMLLYITDSIILHCEPMSSRLVTYRCTSCMMPCVVR